MRSPSKSILVLGDSNVAMVKQLFERKPDIFPTKTVNFWYVTGSKFNTVGISDGILRPPKGVEMHDVQLEDFDIILVCGVRIRTASVFDELLRPSTQGRFRFTEKFIRDVVTDYVSTLPGGRFLRELSQQYGGTLIGFPTPMLSEPSELPSEIAPLEYTRKTYEKIWDCYEEYFTNCRTKILRTPFEITHAGRYVQSRYSVSLDDPLHKNSEFAEMLLSQVFS
jgi:hypothetical protein